MQPGKHKILKRARTTFFAVLLGATLSGSLLTPAGAGGGGTVKATVVHGIPNLTVDVYANGGLLLEDFEPGDIAGPVKLPAEQYDIEITPANSSTVALDAMVDLMADADVAAAAHLTESGDATIGLFKNRMKPIRPGNARVTARHIATAPEVDVRYKRPGGRWKILTEDLANGEQAIRSIGSRKYRFDIVLADSTTRVLGPANLKVRAHRHYFFYAWGSAADGTLDLNMSERRLRVER